MANLEAPTKRNLHLEFVQFLTPHWILPRGVCFAINVELAPDRLRILFRLFWRLWGQRKIWIKEIEI